MPARHLFPVWLRAGAAYAVLALAFAWPLPAHLRDRLTGPVSGDTGVYVWNLWSFQRELAADHSPFFSCAILALTPPVDLSLHNYTVLLDVVALPLLPVLGLTATFNIVYLLAVAATALSAFLLIRRLVPDGPVAWLAGALFAFSPFLVARSMGHFSLVAAAPLPLFVLCLIRAEETGRMRWMFCAGGLVSLAIYSDPYYAVYCAVLAALFLMALLCTVAWRPSRALPWIGYVCGGAIAGVAILIGSIALTGGWTLTLGPIKVGLTTLYTPVLTLVVLIVARIWLYRGPRVRITGYPKVLLAPRHAAAMVAAALVPLSPWLYALGHGLKDGAAIGETMFWRSSPRGVDLLSLVMPNPEHPLLRQVFAGWFSGQPGLAIENVVSLPLVALVVVVVAFSRFRAQAPVYWWAVAGGGALLALGPFIYVGGVNSYVPGPWALLRYVPILSSARMPTRFAVVAVLGLAVLFAYGLQQVLASHPARRRHIFLTVSALLLFELLPAPRVLYSARIPAVYETIAADPRNVSVLNLPVGIRDGVRSEGAFDTSTQYYQTFHRKRIIGGYLSRLSAAELTRNRRTPVLDTMLLLSKGLDASVPASKRLEQMGRRFVRRAHLGYVVVDIRRTPQPLLDYARRAFRLELLAEIDGLALYRPGFEPELDSETDSPLRR